MSSDAFPKNSFTQGSLAAVFAKTALPIIFVMGMNGLLTAVDAAFLGFFVGPDALGAVTLMFPLYMLLAALATLVASGMSSLLARHLGARRFDEARTTFASAHGLGLAVSAVLIALFLIFGEEVTLLLAKGSVPLAEMGHVYLGIIVFFTPAAFLMSVNADALRNEGRAGLMAAMSLLVSLSNILFNYVLIAQMGLGVAGSAYGTAMAQVLALLVILVFRLRGRTVLRPSALTRHRFSEWRPILALGAPQSLNLLGIALGSAAIITALQLAAGGAYETTVSAYGIVTRVMTFIFLPLLGLSQALQSITGNNYGAEEWRRSDKTLRLGLAVALVYCTVAELALVGLAKPVSGLFVDDAAVMGEVGRIMPVMVTLFFLAGPLIMIASYFQAIGAAGRAAVLGLAKPYFFAIPLTFLLSPVFGEMGIWMAAPAAEGMLLCLTLTVLAQSARRGELRWGLFKANTRLAAQTAVAHHETASNRELST